MSMHVPAQGLCASRLHEHTWSLLSRRAQVKLDAEGSEDAWFAVGPRFSFQFEGASVHNHDMLTLYSPKRQLWLHVGPSESVAALGPGSSKSKAALKKEDSNNEINAASTSVCRPPAQSPARQGYRRRYRGSLHV